MNRNQIYFSVFSNYVPRNNFVQNSLTIEMNEYFTQNFKDSPIMNAYRNFPKDFKIIVGSKTYKVMQFVFENIRKIKNQGPSQDQIILNVDNDTIFSYIIDIINGNLVHLSYKDSLLLRVMSKDLYIYPLFDVLSDQNEEFSTDLILLPTSLSLYLQSQPKDFTINTKNNSYKCTKIAAAVSQVIMDAIQADNSIDSYFYDFEDENKEFQMICDYLNFGEVVILPENIDILTKFSKDLQFNALTKILKNVSEQQGRYDDTLNDYQDEIDYVDDLFDALINKNETEAVDYIITSKWLQNDERQKELIGSLISLIYSSPKLLVKVAKLISVLFEKIELIQKSDNESNDLSNIDLKLLKNFLLRRIIDKVEDSHNGPFIYELIKLNFIKLHKSNHSEINNNNENSKNDDLDCEDDSDLLIRCLQYQFTAIWILPELEEIVQGLQNFVEGLKENDMYKVNRFFSNEYTQNNWEKLRKYRDTKENTSPIAIALANDDIDQFQKLFYLPHNDENTQLPTNKFKWRGFGMNRFSQNGNKDDKDNDESNRANHSVAYFEFDLYSDRSYINYAACHGSIQCFKFLLINGAKVNNFTFDAAIEGGNIEIVRITEQKLNEINDDSYYNGIINKNRGGWGKSNSSFESLFHKHYQNELMDHPNGLEHAISKHNNDIFDWIFENKKISTSEFTNLLQIASFSNNLHVISRILSEKPLITNLALCKSFLNSVSNAASLGFETCVKLLIGIFGKDNFKEFSGQFESFISSYDFDNVEIFKITWFKEIDYQLLFELCRSNSLSIFKYCYNESCSNKSFEFLINFAIKNNNEKIFNFLFDQINKTEEDIQREILFNKLLKNTVKCNCFPILKFILQNLKINRKIVQTITKCLIDAAKSGHENIFQYILDWLKANSTFNNHDQKLIVNKISKNLFEIFQSGSLKIIKSIIQLIDNEKYIKTMMFDFLVKESDRIITHEVNESKRMSSMTFPINPQPNSIKSIFSIKNVTEFLISYVDEVIPEFLIAATKVGSIEAVKSIVEKNSSYNFINQVFYLSGNALSIACNNGLNDIAKFLLESCPEIDPTFGFPCNGKYSSPLIISISKQNFELTQAIIQFCQSKEKKLPTTNISNNAQTKSSPLVNEIQIALSKFGKGNIVMNRKFEEIISYLISIDGININEIYCEDNPFLSFLCDDDLIGVFNNVLSLPNTNPNIYNYHSKETPLIKAIRINQNKITMALLNHKDIDINFESYNHITALSMAVYKKNLNVVKLLVENEKLDVDGNLNYSVCLFQAIKNKFIEGIKIMLKRSECNVNEIIPYSYQDTINEGIVNGMDRPFRTFNNFIANNNQRNGNVNQLEEFIKMNISILEKERKYHSVSIIQAAAACEDIEIVKNIINHPKFVPQKSTLTLAIFESIKINNSEIFELLINLYMQLYQDFDILNFYDLNFNSIIFIASASNNIDFINLIPNYLKQNNENQVSSSLFDNQLAFIFAPSVEMMNLIIQTLPGVDLSLPLENGSNYLTALIDFYLNPLNLIAYDKSNFRHHGRNHNLTIDDFVMEKIDFILANSNLKITTKDKNGFSFLTKATSHAHCIHYLEMTSLIYSKFTPQDDDQTRSILIDDETQMNPLHMICSNMQLMNFFSRNRGNSHHQENVLNDNLFECEDDFDILVNLIVIGNFSNVYLKDESYSFRQIFENNSSLFNNNIPNGTNYIDTDINAVDALNQTPIIKAILNMNIYFANFLFTECNAKIDIIDVFGNSLVDYLLMVIDHFFNSFQRVTGFVPSNDYRDIIEKKKNGNYEKNDRDLCSLIFKDLIKFFSNENSNCNLMESNLMVSIIIKLSTYLVPKKIE